MAIQTVHIGFTLSADEYKKLKELCDRNGMYPSEAVRKAVMEWMVKNA